jgi:histidine triad (HIT) family protein
VLQADCLFCKILQGQIPSTKVFEDEWVYAFHDIHPQAPVHILIIPKVHIATLDDASRDQELYLGRMMTAAAQIAAEQGLDKGYRVLMNCKSEGGQVVYHIHLHLLGGRNMGPMVVQP